MKKKKRKIELGDLVQRLARLGGGACGIVIEGSIEGRWCVYWFDHQATGSNHLPENIHFVAELV